MQVSPLSSMVLFHVGPVPITRPVATTWGIMLVLTLGSWLITRSLRLRANSRQAIVELTVTSISDQIKDVMRKDPSPFLPLIATLFIFLVVANLSGIIPGVEAPTAKLETPAALAFIVFLSVHYFGVRTLGLFGYLTSFAKPKLIMLPLNLISQVTRIFSLMIWLFGNIMSGEFIIGLVLAMAGLLRSDPVHGARNPAGPRPSIHLHGSCCRLHRRRRRQRRTMILGASMDHQVISILAAAFAVSFGAIGPALAEGRAVASALDAIARQPEAAGTISRTLFVGLAMIETTAIYCLVIALLLLFANPYIH